MVKFIFNVCMLIALLTLSAGVSLIQANSDKNEVKKHFIHPGPPQ